MSEYSKLTFTDGTLITAELMNQLSDNIEYALETPPSELNVNGKTPDETGKITLAATDVNALYLGDAGTGDAPSLNAGTLGGEKPQSPIMSGTNGIYPLTTADQVIKADGSRLEQNGKVVADDSAKLGGKPAETYALKADLDKKANKSIVSDTWQTGQTYEKGAYCIYNDGLYKALVQTTAEPTTKSDWTKCTVTKEIMSITPKNTEHKQLTTNYGIIDFYECDGVVSFYGNLSNMPVGDKLSVGRVPSSPPIYDYTVGPFYDSDTPFAPIGSVWIYRGGSFDLFKPGEKTSGYVFGTYIGNR